MIPLNVNCKTFFSNINSDFHKKGLIFESFRILKLAHRKIHFRFEGYPCVKMCNVLREIAKKKRVFFKFVMPN